MHEILDAVVSRTYESTNNRLDNLQRRFAPIVRRSPNVSILVIFMFMTCYRFDTPQRYLDMGDRDSALRALQLVYTS